MNDVLSQMLKRAQLKGTVNHVAKPLKKGNIYIFFKVTFIILH